MQYKNLENRGSFISIFIHRHSAFFCSAANLSVNLKMLSGVYIYKDAYPFPISPVKISELFRTQVKTWPSWSGALGAHHLWGSSSDVVVTKDYLSSQVEQEITTTFQERKATGGGRRSAQTLTQKLECIHLGKCTSSRQIKPHPYAEPSGDASSLLQATPDVRMLRKICRHSHLPEFLLAAALNWSRPWGHPYYVFQIHF